MTMRFNVWHKNCFFVYYFSFVYFFRIWLIYKNGEFPPYKQATAIHNVHQFNTCFDANRFPLIVYVFMAVMLQLAEIGQNKRNVNNDLKHFNRTKFLGKRSSCGESNCSTWKIIPKNMAVQLGCLGIDGYREHPTVHNFHSLWWNLL